MSKRPRLFAGYFLEWIETYKVGAIRDISVSKYYIAHKHLTEICPALTIDKLDRKAYQSILNEYALTHERQTTMDFHHQIGSCVRDMYHEGLIKRDPTYKAIIKGIPPRPKKKKFLQKGELQKLLKSLELGEGINMDWFILLVAKTGMRFAEAIALTPADFDWTRNTVSINKTLNYKNSTMFFQDTKNKSSVRTISIDWQIVGQFKPLIENLPQDELIFVNRDEKTGKYKRIFNSTYNSHLIRKCKESGITVITMHGLRHTHASILLADGVSTHSIAKRLGHSSVTTTQETYMHIIDELQSKDDEKILGALMQLS